MTGAATIQLEEATLTSGGESPEALGHWRDCREELRRDMPAAFFESFIRPIQPSIGGEHMRLRVPDEKLRRHIEARYLTRIRSSLRKRGFVADVSVEVGGEAGVTHASEPSAREHLVHRRAVSPATVAAPAPETARADSHPFHPHPSNAHHARALMELRFPPGITFLRGESGTGKTRLARDIVAAAVARGWKASFLGLETFVTEFTQACRGRDVITWRTPMRELDLLVVDDFQFLKKSALRSQEELRHLVDDFSARGARVIFCSDTAAGELPLQADLLSRLYTAYPVELRAPDRDGRRAILRDHLGELGVDLEAGAVEYIADRIRRDARKLRAAALCLAHQGPRGQLAPGEFRHLDAMLGELFEPAAIEPRTVLQAAAEFYRVSVESVVGPSRDRKFVLARHLTAFVCRELLGMKLAQIALLIGRKEHGSIINAERRVREMMASDLLFERQVQDLMARLQS